VLHDSCTTLHDRAHRISVRDSHRISYPVRMERHELLARMRQTLVAYLHDKVADEDWHGVSDAANDLREVDAELRGLIRALSAGSARRARRPAPSA